MWIYIVVKQLVRVPAEGQEANDAGAAPAVTRRGSAQLWPQKEPSEPRNTALS